MKSNILTISGTPVSGKSTAVNALVERLKEQGFSEENIHVFNVGGEFRKYFNAVFYIISNFDDKAKVAEVFEKYPEMKAMSNSILQTLDTLRENGIDASTITIEEANNLPELAAIRGKIDNFIDNKTAKLGKEIIEKDNEDEFWIFDSRLAFSFIPESLAVRLTCRDDIAAKRLMQDDKRGKEDSGYESIEEAKMQLSKRKLGEQKRYKDVYDIDLFDEDNYDLIIDTSFSKTEDVIDTILTCIERYKAGQDFAKKWASPIQFLPTQGIRETWGMGGSGLTFEEIKESIKEHGIYPDKPITAVEVDGKMIQEQGHHRTAALGELGRTLVPYEIVPEAYKEITYSESAREIIEHSRLLEYIGDQEEFYEKGGIGKYKEAYSDFMQDLYDEQSARNARILAEREQWKKKANDRKKDDEER